MAIVGADNLNPAMEMPIIVAVPSGSGHHMHKNCLQVYTQRSGVPLPSYSTFNEGEPHAPRFRATVLVDGLSITSPNTFSQRKESEQDVAKLALEHISVKFKNEGSHYIHKEPVFCKLILNEYGDKLKIEKPTYNTTQQNGILPTFITSVTFDGNTFVGFAGKNKKEAEQNAACVAIDNILANSNEGNVMSQIIKTKDRLYAALNSGANVGNASLKRRVENDGADDFNRESELVAISTKGSLPVGSTSFVPHTSWVDVAQSSQVNYQIPSLGLPAAVVDSRAIILKKKKKQSRKKRQGGQSKRIKVEEQPLTSSDPVNNEQRAMTPVMSKSNDADNEQEQ